MQWQTTPAIIEMIKVVSISPVSQPPFPCREGTEKVDNIAYIWYNVYIKYRRCFFMIEQQQKLILSPYMEIYELVIPKDNLLRQIKERVSLLLAHILTI